MIMEGSPPPPTVSSHSEGEFSERIHSRWMNIRTASGFGIPLAGLLAIAAASQVYTVVYKVPVSRILTATLILSIWNIINNSIIGALQDKEIFGKCFDKETWGRRAPWIFTHIPVGSLLIFLTWYPPSVDPDFLLLWFAVLVFFVYWVFSTLLIGTAAGVAELYPFKEERLRVDLWILFWAIGYAGFLMLAFGIVLLAVDSDDEDDELDNNVTDICLGTQDEQADFNLAVSEKARDAALGPAILLGILFLVSLLSIKPLREAKRVTEETAKNPLWELWDLLKTSYAYRIFVLFSLVDGIEALVDIGFLIYYLSYVSKLTGFERTLYLGAAPALGYFIAAIMGFLWVNLFSEKALNPTRYAQAGLLLNTLIRPIIIFSSQSGEALVLAFAIRTALISPRPFWNTAVRGWTIDDDCQKNEGKRREGLIIGFVNTIRNFGSIIIQLLTIGMEVAGIDNTIPDGCDQDESGIFYLLMMYGLLVPALNFIEIFIIEAYPIKGEKLEKLLENQRTDLIAAQNIVADIEPITGVDLPK